MKINIFTTFLKKIEQKASWFSKRDVLFTGVQIILLSRSFAMTKFIREMDI